MSTNLRWSNNSYYKILVLNWVCFFFLEGLFSQSFALAYNAFFYPHLGDYWCYFHSLYYTNRDNYSNVNCFYIPCHLSFHQSIALQVGKSTYLPIDRNIFLSVKPDCKLVRFFSVRCSQFRYCLEGN